MFSQAKSHKSTAALIERGAARTYDGPDTILLPDMIRTRPERLLTADGETTSIHQVTEELPTYA